MIWLYLSSSLGFYIFSAVSCWAQYEESKFDIEFLKKFISEAKVYTFYAFLFGWIGPFFNFDSVTMLGSSLGERLVNMPGGAAFCRSFAIGIGGPLAASKLFSIGKDRQKQGQDRSGSLQVDDTVSNHVDDTIVESSSDEFWEKSKKLFVF